MHCPPPKCWLSLYLSCNVLSQVNATRHQAHTLCKAATDARNHAQTPEALMIKQQRQCVLKEHGTYTLKPGDNIWTFHDQHVPSRVVPMNLESIDVQTLMKRMRRVNELNTEIHRLQTATDGYGYGTLSFQFDNAALFHPECAIMWRDNKDRMRKQMPSLKRCHCNAFIVSSQQEAYQTHHASSIGYETTIDALRNKFVPKRHMSFHTALHATNLTTAPFTVFDAHVPETFNMVAMVNHLKGNTKVSMETRCEMQYVTTLLENGALDFRHIQDYVTLCYWEHQACERADKGGHGSWWSLQAGEAIVFNNWRAHSDAYLGTIESPRYTLDMRCFGPVTHSNGISTTHDVALKILQHDNGISTNFIRKMYAATGCISQLFNVTSQDFLQFFPDIYHGTNASVTMQEMVGSLALNLIDRPEISLVHNYEKTKAYYAMVEDIFESNAFNVPALVACLQQVKGGASRRQVKEL